MTELEQKLAALRKFAEGEGTVAILVHPEPDPDALASALAMRALLRRDPDSSPIVTLGGMTRPENRRMAELLSMRVTEVTTDELVKLERVVSVDFQPNFRDPQSMPRLAIVDHHPNENACAEFSDIRDEYGSVSTMMTEYLRLDDERRIGRSLATALLYGIKTDTGTLERECIGADVLAYAFLQDRADLTLLRMLARPSYSTETARRYGAALANLASCEDMALVYLGEIEEEDGHVLAEVADFCLSLDEITWAVATAVVDGKFIVTIRKLGGDGFGAGDLAMQLAEQGGSGGGHATMARATLPRADWPDKAELILDRLAQLIGRQTVKQ